MPNEMKMWCLCNKKTKKPIIISVDRFTNIDIDVIGFSRKKDLFEAIDGEDTIEYDEEIRRISFLY